MSFTFSPSMLITPLIDFITGKIIESGAGGDAAKLTARAAELIVINQALVDINAGSPNGVTELASALNTQSLTPGEALAVQSLFASLSNQAALLTTIAGSTLLGQANTVILDSILATATATAQAYVAKYKAAA